MTDPCAERQEVGQLLRNTGAPDSSSFDVFLSGTIFMDMIFTGLPGVPRPGTELFTDGLGSAPGGVANLAVALSRLGMHVSLAAAFGDDMFGAYLWRTLAEQERVDLTHSRRLANWPTPVTVSLSYDQDRSMITYGEPPPSPTASTPATPPAARTCFLELGAGEPPAWVERMRKAGAVTFGDVGWDGSGRWSSDVLDRLAHIDVFLPNAVEAMAYTRTDCPGAALSLLAERVPVVVVKNGAEGALAVDAVSGESVEVPALPVDEVLDATGAGDVFAAAFVFGTLAGWSLTDRVRFANLCAGLSVQHFSGSLGAPCWGELAAWWEEAGQIPEIRADYGFLVPYLPSDAYLMPRARPTVGDYDPRA